MEGGEGVGGRGREGKLRWLDKKGEKSKAKNQKERKICKNKEHH